MALPSEHSEDAWCKFSELQEKKKQNLIWYDDHFDELYKKYPLRYLLIKNASLVGDYETQQEALQDKALLGIESQSASVVYCKERENVPNTIERSNALPPILDTAIATLPSYWFLISALFLINAVLARLGAFSTYFSRNGTNHYLVFLCFFVLPGIGAAANGNRWAKKLFTLKYGRNYDTFPFVVKGMAVALLYPVMAWLICLFTFLIGTGIGFFLLLIAVVVGFSWLTINYFRVKFLLAKSVDAIERESGEKTTTSEH